MGLRLGDLVERYDPWLELTVGGKVYRVPLASAELGLWCRTNAALAGQAAAAGGTPEAIEAAGQEAIELPEGLSFEQWMLGDAYDKLVADDVSFRHIDLCAKTAFLWHTGADDDRVAAFWNAGGDPEQARPAENRADKRKAAKKAGTGGRSTAAAAKTPKRASTSGTTSPTKRAIPRAKRPAR